MKDWYEVEVLFTSEGIKRNELQSRSLEIEADEFTRGIDRFHAFVSQGEKMVGSESPSSYASRDYDRITAYAIPEAVKVVEHVRQDPFVVSSIKVTGFVRDERKAVELERLLKAPFGDRARSRVQRMEEATPQTH